MQLIEKLKIVYLIPWKRSTVVEANQCPPGSKVYSHLLSSGLIKEKYNTGQG